MGHTTGTVLGPRVQNLKCLGPRLLSVMLFFLQVLESLHKYNEIVLGLEPKSKHRIIDSSQLHTQLKVTGDIRS